MDVPKGPRENDLFQLLFREAHSPQLLLEENAEGRMIVRTINSATEKLVGKEEEEIRGLHGGDVFGCINALHTNGCGDAPACSDCEIRAAVMDTFERGTHHHRKEISMEIGSPERSSTRAFSITTLLVVREQRRSLLLTVEDITRQKRTERALRKAEKMEALGTLAAGIGHDFNNILTILVGNFDILESGIEEIFEIPGVAFMLNTLTDKQSLIIQEIFRYIHEGQEATRNGISLTNNLIAFCREKERKLVRIDPHTSIEEQSPFIRNILGKSITLIIETSSDLEGFYMGDGEFFQSLLNLCTNAQDALKEKEGERIVLIEGRNISRSVHINEISRQEVPPGEYVCISVRDNGCGIDKSEIDHISEIFEHCFTTKDKGTGLGLATLLRLVQNNGGFIEVESEAGKGTSFHLFFPACVPDPEQKKLPVVQEVTSLPESLEILRGKKILIVDDEEMAIYSLISILMREDMECFSAQNGEEALKILEEHSEIDVILTDETMPRMSGTELQEEISKKHPNIPIILMSGITSEENKQVPQIEKPFKPKDILEIIVKVLSQTTPKEKCSSV